jgi:hypothetical protein
MEIVINDQKLPLCQPQEESNWMTTYRDDRAEMYRKSVDDLKKSESDFYISGQPNRIALRR